jgi:hypothetical protein
MEKNAFTLQQLICYYMNNNIPGKQLNITDVIIYMTKTLLL